jgi:hypothetical protein
MSVYLCTCNAERHGGLHKLSKTLLVSALDLDGYLSHHAGILRRHYVSYLCQYFMYKYAYGYLHICICSVSPLCLYFMYMYVYKYICI